MKKLIFFGSFYAALFYVSCKSKPVKVEVPSQKKDSVISLKLTTSPQAKMNEPGMNTDYYANGKEKMKGLMKDGNREGLWQAWYENGNLWSEAEYTHGLNNGKSATYFENGKVRYKGNYEKGKKVGKWKYYDDEGKLIKTVQN